MTATILYAIIPVEPEKRWKVAKNKFFLILTIVSMTLFLTGCDNPAANPSNVTYKEPTDVVCYGNGVYYFPYRGVNYGNALSRFIKTHPELELIDATGDGNGSHGRDIGYFVVFRDK